MKGTETRTPWSSCRACGGHEGQPRVELDVEHALAPLFAVARALLDACAWAEDVPEAHGAVVAARHEREARGVDREQHRRVEVCKHHVRALAYVRLGDARH